MLAMKRKWLFSFAGGAWNNDGAEDDEARREEVEKGGNEKSAAGRPIGSLGAVLIFRHNSCQFANC